MSVPVVENIAANIKTAVDAVTVANGYNQTLSALRPRRNDWSDVVPEDGRVLIWQSDDEVVDAAAVMTHQFTQEFLLVALVIDSDTASTSIDTRINQVAADLRKKLLVDPTRGGLALDTRLGPAAKFDDGMGFSGVSVSVMVDYRTDYDDPYTQA